MQQENILASVLPSSPNLEDAQDKDAASIGDPNLRTPTPRSALRKFAEVLRDNTSPRTAVRLPRSSTSHAGADSPRSAVFPELHAHALNQHASLSPDPAFSPREATLQHSLEHTEDHSGEDLYQTSQPRAVLSTQDSNFSLLRATPSYAEPLGFYVEPELVPDSLPSSWHSREPLVSTTPIPLFRDVNFFDSRPQRRLAVSSSEGSAALPTYKVASAFGSLNTIDGIRSAFATNVEFSADEIVQIFEFICPSAENSGISSLSTEECKTLFVNILAQKRLDDVPKDSSHSLMIVWLFLTWQRMQIKEAKQSQRLTQQIFLAQVISEDILEYTGKFLLRAMRAHQFHFEQVKHTLTGPLLESLYALLQDSVSSRDANSYPFYIEFPLWLLCVICMFLHNPSAQEQTYTELFNTNRTTHKLFVAKLFDHKDAPWLVSTLKSLPSDLVQNMLIGFLSPYLVNGSDIYPKLLTELLRLFMVHHLDWFKRFSVLFEEYWKAQQIGIEEVREWIIAIVEICKANLKETDFEEGVACLMRPIIMHCLQHHSLALRQLFRVSQGTFDGISWHEIVVQSMKDALSTPIAPNLVARVSPELITELDLQDSIINFIALYLENADVHDQPVEVLCEVLDQLLVGRGLEVVDAFARGIFAPNRSAMDQHILYISLSQLTFFCKRYDPGLILTTHYEEIRSIFEKYGAFSKPDLSMLNSNFTAYEQNAENEEDESAKIISDFFCIMVKIAAEIGVKNLIGEAAQKNLESLGEIQWRAGDDYLSLLQIYVSSCVVRTVLNYADFHESMITLRSSIVKYFQIDAIQICEYHRPAVQEYTQIFTKFIAAFKSYLHVIFDLHRCTKQYLEKLQLAHVVISLARVCNLPDFAKYDIFKLSERFTAAIQARDEIQLVRTWLLAKGVIDERDSPPIGDAEITLHEMEQQIVDSERQLRLEPPSLALLKIFVLDTCVHLRIIIAKSHPEIDSSEAITFEQLANSLDNAHKYLQNLLETDVPLSVLEPHLEHKQTFISDLRLLAACIPHKCTDIDARCELLANGLELRLFTQNLHLLFKCAKHFNLRFSDKSGLKNFHAQLLRADYPLSIASIQLQTLPRFLGTFPADFLPSFAEIQRAAPIVDFFCSLGETWQKKFDSLMVKQEGYQIGIAKLNALSAVYKLLEPFVKFRGAQAYSHVDHFCELMMKQFGVTPTHTDISVHIANLHSVLDDLPEIQEWFSHLDGYQIEKVLPRIFSVLQFGYYRSTCTRKGAMLNIWTNEIDKKLSVSEGELQDLLRAKVFVHNLNAETHQKERIHKFVDCYMLASKAHSIHCLLSNLAHPEYQKEFLRIPESGPMGNEEAIRTQYKALRQALAAWDKQLRDLYSSAPRLLFLEPFQLAYFVRSFHSSLLQISDFKGYLWMCFPDYPRSALTKVIAELGTFNAPISEEPGLEVKLQAIAVLVNAIASKLTPAAQVSVDRKPPEVCRLTSHDPHFLYHLIASLNNGPPHPAIFLELSPSTPKRDVIFFLRRACKFPYLKYFLVGVDLASLKVQATLVKHLKNQQASVGQLYLVFLANTGIERFNFLHCKEYRPPDINTEMPTTIARHKSVAMLAYCMGEPCAGKTTYISQQLKTFSCAIRISANEDFTVAAFSKALTDNEPHISKDEGVIRVGVHLNISAFAPWKLLNTFLFHFVVFGVLWNPDNGRLSFPSGIEWFIYVELGQTSSADAKFPGRNSASQILSFFPVLKHLGVSIQHTNFSESMPPSPDSIVCFNFIRHFGSAYTSTSVDVEPSSEVLNLTTIPKELGNETSWWKELHALLTPQFCPTTRASWDIFFKILCSRCCWLKLYAQIILHQMDENPIKKEILPLQTLFKAFLIEAKQLSEGPISQPSLMICCSLHQGKTEMSVLNFSKNETEGIPEISKEDAERNPKLLYTALALAFNFYGPLEKIFNEQKFVLTPDFAAKLIAMHERLTSEYNVILYGDHGTGKTETMKVYSEIMSSKYLPDLAEEFRVFLRALLLDRQQLQPIFPIFEHVLEFDGRDWHTKFSSSTQDLIRILNIMLDSPSDFSATLASKVVQHISSMLKNWPLIKRTPLLMRTKRYFQPEVLVLPNIAPPGAKSYVVDSRTELTQLVTEYLEAQMHTLFYHIRMDYKLTAREFSQKITAIIEALKEAKYEERKARVIVFLDELNSTSIMGVLKEVFVDRSLNGQPLPPSLLFVGAMNPNRELPNGAFNAIPPSMEFLTIRFRTHDHIGDESFLRCLGFAQARSEDAAVEESTLVAMNTLLAKVQEFMRAAAIQPTVSVSDIMHVVMVFKFLNDTEPGGEVLSMVAKIGTQNQLEKPNDSIAIEGEPAIAPLRHWQALIISIALVYYFRLPFPPPSFPLSSDAPPTGNDRVSFAKFLNSHLQQEGISLAFDSLITFLLDNFFSATTVPAGIAPTNSLKENIFCIALCIEISIPLVILGPASSAKNLALTIVTDNMIGRRANRSPYNSFHNIRIFRYEVSKHMLDADLEQIYAQALDFQQSCASETPGHRSVVLLNCVHPIDFPLSVLDSYLDHPLVSSVLFTTYEGSLPVRCLQLRKSKMSDYELQILAKECSGITNEAILQAVIQAYSITTAKPTFCHRDFVFFLRYLRAFAPPEIPCELTPDLLVHALAHNFNGIPLADFCALVELFFSKIREASHSAFPVPDTLRSITFYELITRRLRGPNKSLAPYIPTARHIMLLDPTDNETSISLLFSLGVFNPQNTHVCSISNLTDDSLDPVKGDVILKIKHAMEAGETIILLNSNTISHCFYDVFNCQYMALTGSKKYQLYAHIAIGSHSLLCSVHENFKLMLHVPISELQKTSSIASRFERYLVSMDQTLQHLLFTIPVLKVNNYQISAEILQRSIKKNCTSLIEHIAGSLCGFVPEETIGSLVYNTLTSIQNFNLDTGPTANTTGFPNAIVIEDFEEEEISPIHKVVRRANLQLLQLTRPEQIYASRTRIPLNYLHEYLITQEHFSLVRFFHLRVAQLYDDNPSNTGKKWCVFTRTSDELLRVCADPGLQQLFFPAKCKFSRSQLKFMDLSAVKSAGVCKKHVEEFASSGKFSAMICVANMSTCDPKTINLFRALIASHTPRVAEKLITLVLHYPAYAIPSYHATFVYGWEFSFVDDFGTYDAARHSKIDVRAWIAAGYGLQVKIPEQTIIGYFYTHFLEYIRHCCTNLVLPKQLDRLLPFSKEFYNSGNPSSRFNTIKQIFECYPTLLENILKTFSEAWTTTLLHKTLVDAWEKHLGLLSYLYSSLHRLLSTLAGQIVASLCSNYAVERILEIQSRNEGEQVTLLHSLVSSMVSLTSFPFSADHPAPKFDHPSPSATLLYDFLISRLQNLAAESEQKVAPGAEDVSHTRFLEVFLRLVSEDSLLSSFQLIAATPTLLRSFTSDFLSRTLHLSPVYDLWIDAVANFLVRFAQTFGIRTGSALLDYFLVFHLHRQFVLRFCTLVRPLIPLHNPQDLIAKLTNTNTQVTTLDELESFFWDHIVREMWAQIIEIDQNQLANWMSVFRHLHHLAPHHIFLLDTLSRPRVLQWDLMNIWVFFLSASSINIQLGTRANINQSAEYQGLQSLLPVISQFCDLLGDSHKETFVNNVLAYFLSVPEQGHYSEIQRSAIKTNFSFFIGLCQKADSPEAKLFELSFVRKYWAINAHFASHIPFQTQLEQIAALASLAEKRSYFYFPQYLYRHYLKFAKQNSFFCDAVFFALRRKYSNEHEHSSLGELCKVYATRENYLHQAAIATIILQRVAASLIISSQISDTEKSVIRKILENGNQHPPIVNEREKKRNLAGMYLLQLLPKQVIVRTLQSEYWMDTLQLEPWKLADNSNTSVGLIYALLPFMIEEETALGAAFHDLLRVFRQGQAKLIWKKILHTINGTSPHFATIAGLTYQTRMFIILISYYHFFNLMKPCEPLLALLRKQKFIDLLNITEKEKVIFKFIASGPRELMSAVDMLEYQFSVHRDSNHSTVAHIMVNCLAIALGTPNDSNHLYPRMFDVLQQVNSCGPGSALESKKNSDTGYTMGPEGNLPYNDKIMGGHALSRLVLNITVWASYAWACFVSPSALQDMPDFLTFWKQDLGFLDQYRYGVVNIRTFMKTSIQNFYDQLCADKEVQEKKVGGLHFINEALFLIWQETTKPKYKSAGWCSQYKTPEDATKYENLLKAQIFDVVLREYPTLNVPYQFARNAHLREILSAQQLHAQRFASPLITRSDLLGYIQTSLSNLPTSHLDAPTSRAKLEFLGFFVQNLEKIHVLRHLPTLVRFYTFLNSKRARKVTRAEAHDTATPSFLARNATGRIVQSEEWEPFKLSWQDIRLAYNNEPQEIDDFTPMYNLLSIAPNEDPIFSIIYRLVNLQEIVLEKHNQIDHKFSPRMYIGAVAFYEARETVVMGGYSLNDVEELMLPNMSLDPEFTKESLSFDIERIVELVSEKLFFNKPILYTVGFQKRYTFLDQSSTTDMTAKNDDVIAPATSTYTEQIPTQALASRLPNALTIVPPSPSSTRFLPLSPPLLLSPLPTSPLSHPPLPHSPLPHSSLSPFSPIQTSSSSSGLSSSISLSSSSSALSLSHGESSESPSKPKNAPSLSLFIPASPAYPSLSHTPTFPPSSLRLLSPTTPSFSGPTPSVSTSMLALPHGESSDSPSKPKNAPSLSLLVPASPAYPSLSHTPTFPPPSLLLSPTTPSSSSGPTPTVATSTPALSQGEFSDPLPQAKRNPSLALLVPDSPTVAPISPSLTPSLSSTRDPSQKTAKNSALTILLPTTPKSEPSSPSLIPLLNTPSFPPSPSLLSAKNSLLTNAPVFMPTNIDPQPLPPSLFPPSSSLQPSKNPSLPISRPYSPVLSKRPITPPTIPLSASSRSDLTSSHNSIKSEWSDEKSEKTERSEKSYKSRGSDLGSSTSSLSAQHKKAFVIIHKEREIAKVVLNPVIGSKLYTLVKKKVTTPFSLMRDDTDEIIPDSSEEMASAPFPARTTLRVVDKLQQNSSERVAIPDLPGEETRARFIISAKHGADIFTLEPDDPQQLTFDWIFTALAGREISILTHVICSSTGIVLEEGQFSNYIKTAPAIAIERRSDLINITYKRQSESLWEGPIPVARFTTPTHFAEFYHLPPPLFSITGAAIPSDSPLSESIRIQNSNAIQVIVRGNPDTVREITMRWENRSHSVQILVHNFSSNSCIEYARQIFGIAPEVQLTLKDQEGYEFMDRVDADVDIGVRDLPTL